MPPLLVVGCAPWGRPLPVPEVTQAGVAARVVVPRDLNVNPAESVVEPGTPRQEPAEPPASHGVEPERTTFALADAIAFALRNSPRLRSARAAIERARGQEQVAFAPFLPQVDLLGQYGVVSGTLAPGVVGSEGFILANGSGTRSYAQTEVGLQWTLYDFGRTGGRYHQTVARGHIAELQVLRADQTVEFAWRAPPAPASTGICDPARQYVITLSDTLEFETRFGETCALDPARQGDRRRWWARGASRMISRGAAPTSSSSSRRHRASTT